MELKGSKTEQNLLTAFAGESQARGNCGSRLCMEIRFLQLRRIWRMLLRVKTTSGQTCTNIWQKQLVRKVS